VAPLPPLPSPWSVFPNHAVWISILSLFKFSLLVPPILVLPTQTRGLSVIVTPLSFLLIPLKATCLRISHAAESLKYAVH
jgi:hypothetical protein